MWKYSEYYYICISEYDEKIGWVGVVNNDIRIAVEPKWHKKGVGKYMLQHIKDRFPKATAQIFNTNKASIKLFESLDIPIRIKE